MAIFALSFTYTSLALTLARTNLALTLANCPVLHALLELHDFFVQRIDLVQQMLSSRGGAFSLASEDIRIRYARHLMHVGPAALWPLLVSIECVRIRSYCCEGVCDVVELVGGSIRVVVL